jgi:sugar/nucleoside kinase (ribokinase family)
MVSTINAPVLGIGDALVDLNTFADQIPAKGGNVWSTAVTMTPGGTTANIVAGLSSLGINSHFVGCIGKDAFGTFIYEDFKRLGVDTSWIYQLEDTFTGFVLSIVDPEGERTFIACAKGAAFFQMNAAMFKDINFSQFPLSFSTGVCLVEEPSRTILLTVYEKIKQAGCPLYFDPNLRPDGDVFPDVIKNATWQAFKYAEVVLIGDEELKLLSPGFSDIEVIERIKACGPSMVVLKQGEKGATLFSDQGTEYCPGFDVSIISTQGAGDAFDAGFIAGRLRGYPDKEALKYACGVAGLKVASGGSRALPTHEQTQAFIKSVNSR